MIVTFSRDVPIGDTMFFEELYEESLRLDKDDKAEVISNGYAAWMFVDGEPAGEVYGICPDLLDEEIKDVEKPSPDSIYCYSTTIIPIFRGKGLGKLLKAYWLGLVAHDFKYVIGHSTSPEMVSINKFFGAEHAIRHDKWYETERTAWFYKLPL